MNRTRLFMGLIVGLSVLAFSCQSTPPTAPPKAAEPVANPAEQPAKPVGKTLNVHMGTPTVDSDMDDATAPPMRSRPRSCLPGRPRPTLRQGFSGTPTSYTSSRA